MQIEELPIRGAFRVTPQVHRDSRGAFLEWFRADRFIEAVGHRLEVAQANCSVSAGGTVRGVHFADVPPGQAKYVTCAAGAVLDVVVDLRVGSPTFGTWEAVRLDEDNRGAVYLGEGLGHAFMALTGGTVVQYLCSTPYAPDREHGVDPFDADLDIAWPTTNLDGRPVEHLVSERDRRMPTLAEAQEAGLLPSYEAVESFLGRLPS